MKRFTEFSNGCYANFIPVEERFAKTMKGFIRSIVASVFEAASIDQILEDIAVVRRLDRFIVLGNCLVQELDAIAAVLWAHSAVSSVVVRGAMDRKAGWFPPT